MQLFSFLLSVLTTRYQISHMGILMSWTSVLCVVGSSVSFREPGLVQLTLPNKRKDLLTFPFLGNYAAQHSSGLGSTKLRSHSSTFDCIHLYNEFVGIYSYFGIKFMPSQDLFEIDSISNPRGRTIYRTINK